MLRPEKSSQLDRPVLASLESLVPQTHFYQQLDAGLDLSFIREWVKDCYAPNGRPSIDPIVFVKVQRILCFGAFALRGS